MSSAVASFRKARTQSAESLADVLHRLGDVPAFRIRMQPYPANEQDVLNIFATEKRLFEIVDDLLVEKAMGFKASWLGAALLVYLFEFVQAHDLGLVVGEAGMMRLSTGLLRIPDVSFIAWDRIPGGKVPDQPVPKLSPNLAAEVLSESNTPAEMKRKLREYFKAGVLLVWILDPETRTVAVHAGTRKPKILKEEDTLDGGSVVPGFKLALPDLFAVLDQKAPK